MPYLARYRQNRAEMSPVHLGISSLADHPEGDVAKYLAPLFDHARSIIPPSQLANTPVYILATAGMRLIPDSHSSAILRGACRYIQQSTPFKLRNCDEQVRIISGEEEGVYGWVAINYLMDGFDSHGVADKGKGRHSSTYGFLDMGGASTQIAFEPSTEARKEHADNLLSVNLRLLDGMDVHHPVFVTTWLGYGTNQARERYVEAAMAQYLKEHPPDSSNSASLGSEKPVQVVPDPCLPNSLLLTETKHPGYAMQGTGDFPACLVKVAPLLNKEMPCPDEPCLMGVHVPPIDFNVNHFIGISEYWYSTQDLWSMGGAYDFPTFEKSAMEYCSQNWEAIVRDYAEGGQRLAPGHKPADVHRLEMQCFKAAWIVNVLHDGIGIPRLAVDKGGEGGRGNGTEEVQAKAGEKGFATTTTSSFQSVNEINDVAVSWTLGRMVLEVTDSIPRSSKTPEHAHDEDANTPVFEWKTGHSTGSWRSRLDSVYRKGKEHSVPLAAVALLLGVALLYLLCIRRRRQASGLDRGRKPSRGGQEYGLLAMEEAGANGHGHDGHDVATSPRKNSSAFSRSLFLPLRVFASRFFSSHPFSWAGAGGRRHNYQTYSLPVTRAVSPTRTVFKPLVRPTVNLRHVNSSPALFRGSPPTTSNFSSVGSGGGAGAAVGSSLPSSRSNLHLDLNGAQHHHHAAATVANIGDSPPLTPPARNGFPLSALGGNGRGKTSPHRHGPGHGHALVKKTSKRALHMATASEGGGDAEGFLSVPVGVSSNGPSSVGNGWDTIGNEGGGLAISGLLGKPASSSDENIPGIGIGSGGGLRSRQASYTNLGALARQRGGHSRMCSTEVA